MLRQYGCPAKGAAVGVRRSYLGLRFGVVAVLAGGMMLVAVPASSAAVAAAVPGQPGGVTASARPGGAVVTWSPPASNGGSPVSGYVITASPGGKTVATASVTSFLVGGLTNGTAYRFTVAAVNAAGTGPASRPSGA